MSMKFLEAEFQHRRDHSGQQLGAEAYAARFKGHVGSYLSLA